MASLSLCIIIMENTENNNNERIIDIKHQILNFYKYRRTIHFSVPKGNKRIDPTEVIVIGVYDSFFCVKTINKRFNETFTIMYVDVFIKGVVIEEIC